MTRDLTKSELNEVDEATAELFGAMNEVVLKMSTRKDFFDLVDMITYRLGEFQQTHSELATQRLAENICVFSVYDISDDVEWQDTIRNQLTELSESDDYSEEELEPSSRWLNSVFQLELGAPRAKSTYLRLVDSNTANPVLEVKVW